MTHEQTFRMMKEVLSRWTELWNKWVRWESYHSFVMPRLPPLSEGLHCKKLKDELKSEPLFVRVGHIDQWSWEGGVACMYMKTSVTGPYWSRALKDGETEKLNNNNKKWLLSTCSPDRTRAERQNQGERREHEKRKGESEGEERRRRKEERWGHEGRRQEKQSQLTKWERQVEGGEIAQETHGKREGHEWR